MFRSIYLDAFPSLCILPSLHRYFVQNTWYWITRYSNHCLNQNSPTQTTEAYRVPWCTEYWYLVPGTKCLPPGGPSLMSIIQMYPPRRSFESKDSCYVGIDAKCACRYNNFRYGWCQKNALIILVMYNRSG